MHACLLTDIARLPLVGSPILVAVVVAYMVGQIHTVSIFESILELKGLITMPEFKDRETYLKTAQQVCPMASHPHMAHHPHLANRPHVGR